MKGNGFDPGLMSQTALHGDSSLKTAMQMIICDINPVSNPVSFIVCLLIKVQLYDHFSHHSKPIKKVNFQ